MDFQTDTDLSLGLISRNRTEGFVLKVSQTLHALKDFFSLIPLDVEYALLGN